MGFTRTHEHLKVRHDVTDVPVIDYGYGNCGHCGEEDHSTSQCPNKD